MRPGRPTADEPGLERPTGGALMRGVALIAIAVVLGIVLLQATDSAPFDDAADGDGDATTTTSAPGEAPTTTTTAAANRPPGSVTVLVANGSGVSGAATRVSATVTAGGFQTSEPANAESVQRSVSYFAPGFEAEARAVAALFTPPPDVQALPDPPPVPNLRAASVVLVIAEDLAGG